MRTVEEETTRTPTLAGREVRISIWGEFSAVSYATAGKNEEFNVVD